MLFQVKTLCACAINTLVVELYTVFSFFLSIEKSYISSSYDILHSSCICREKCHSGTYCTVIVLSLQEPRSDKYLLYIINDTLQPVNRAACHYDDKLIATHPVAVVLNSLHLCQAMRYSF